MIKTVIGKLIKEEKGQILTMVLLLLIIGSLLIAPTLANASTTLIAGRMYNERSQQLYAADAGVEDALHKLSKQWDNPNMPKSDTDPPWTYSLADLNNKKLSVSITKTATGQQTPFHIVSTASGGSSSTTVDTYALATPIFLKVEAIAKGTGTINNNNGDIVGDAYAASDPGGITPPFVWKGPYQGAWPTATQLMDYYYPKAAPPNPQTPGSVVNTIDVKNNKNIGPLYVNGDLSITNSGGDTTANLTGTVYVTGQLTIDPPHNKPFTLNMNGNTIFVASNVHTSSLGTNNRAVYIGPDCTVSGSGAIIAVGDVYFEPHTGNDPNSFLFVLSIDYAVVFKPANDFYGSVAGAANVSIQIQPNSTLILKPVPPGGIDFPTIDPTTGAPICDLIWSAAYWKSIRQ